MSWWSFICCWLTPSLNLSFFVLLLDLHVLQSFVSLLFTFYLFTLSYSQFIERLGTYHLFKFKFNYFPKYVFEISIFFFTSLNVPIETVLLINIIVGKFLLLLISIRSYLWSWNRWGLSLRKSIVFIRVGRRFMVRNCVEDLAITRLSQVFVQEFTFVDVGLPSRKHCKQSRVGALGLA
jgi:hypothetical protein